MPRPARLAGAHGQLRWGDGQLRVVVIPEHVDARTGGHRREVRSGPATLSAPHRPGLDEVVGVGPLDLLTDGVEEAPERGRCRRLVAAQVRVAVTLLVAGRALRGFRFVDGFPHGDRRRVAVAADDLVDPVPVRDCGDGVAITGVELPVAPRVPGRVLPVPVVATAVLIAEGEDQQIAVAFGRRDDTIETGPVPLMCHRVGRHRTLESPGADQRVRGQRREELLECGIVELPTAAVVRSPVRGELVGVQPDGLVGRATEEQPPRPDAPDSR